MSKILIAGGSGLVGRRLTQLLKQDGHEVVLAEPAFCFE
jgi:uncharacterized protein YbjT (DUF2867 family)